MVVSADKKLNKLRYAIEIEIASVARDLGQIAEELRQIAQGVDPKYKVCCPHCLNDNTIKKGKTKNGLQRYYCKDCGVFFTVKTFEKLQKI